MIENISRVKNRIAEIESKVSELKNNSTAKDNFKKELQKTVDNGDKKTIEKIKEEIKKVENGEDPEITPELLNSIKGVAGVSKLSELKSKNSLDFYKTITDNLF